MMNQEEYVDARSLKNEGWTNKEIAEELGFHPATIAKWLAADGPPAPPVIGDDRRVMDSRWRARLVALLVAHPRLLGVSVHNKLRAEGFTGSYPTVVRAVRDVRGPRFRAAAAVSVPIHTEPGEEDQFDFANLDDVAAAWGWEHRLRCFGAISCWPRERLWWFTTSEDQEHTFEGIVRAFEAFGGVPAVVRTDRMGALGSSQGQRFTLHPAAVGFAAHHGVKITTCRARDAKRKGKVERPFRQLRETFIPELDIDGPPADLAELNNRAQVWLAERVHAVASRSTGVPPAERALLEREFRAPLPTVRFDTDYVETRRVHNVVPFVAVDGVRYSVPPNVSASSSRSAAVSTPTPSRSAGPEPSSPATPSQHQGCGRCGPTITARPRSPKLSAVTNGAANATSEPSNLPVRPVPAAAGASISGRETSTSTPPISPAVTASTATRRQEREWARPLRTDQDRPRLPPTEPGR